MPEDILTQNSLEELRRQFLNHQHRGSDGSQQIALLDWKLLARNTLAVAAASLVMDLIPSRTFIKVFIQHGAKSGVSDNYLRFNNVSSGTPYTFIEEINNVARTSQNQIDLCDGANSAAGYFYIIDLVNIANLEKVIDSVAIRRITSAATGQTRHRVSGTFVQTTSAITRIDLISSNTQTFPANSSIAVFGSNF